MQTLASLITALEIAKVATSGLCVPGLSSALDSALGIAQKVQEIKDCRDDCQALAERAASFALAVYQQLKGNGGDTGLTEHVMALLHNLHDIENLMDRRLRAGKKRRILFALRHQKVVKEVRELTTKLEDSYRTFMIQAALSHDRQMSILASGNVRIMQHIEDSARVGDFIRTGLSDLAQRVDGATPFEGNFRLFARENLHFLEPIVDSHKMMKPAMQPDEDHTLVRTTPPEQTGRVMRYRAVVKGAGELSGTQVVVSAYPDRSDRRFVDAVEFAKQTCHPYILAVLGYSRPTTPHETSYLVTEDYRSFAEYLSTFNGTSRLRVILQMTTEICMATDYLEQTGLHQLLSSQHYWNSSARYSFGLDELVFDYQHGGRIKWARDLLSPAGANYRGHTAIPAVQEERSLLAEDARSTAGSSAESIMRAWLSFILKPMAVDVDIVGHSWMRVWQLAIDSPLYPCGAWLGYSRYSNGEGSVLSAPDSGITVTRTFEHIPDIMPWRGSRSDGSQKPVRRGGHNEQHLDKKRGMAKRLEVLESDLAEMCVPCELAMDKTRWMRYQFSCVPDGATLLFREHAYLADTRDTASRVLRSVPDFSVEEYSDIAIGVNHIYFTETTITRAGDRAEEGPPPLWFFVLQHDSDAVHSYETPCGFWSLKKNPTAVPASVVFDPTREYERIEGRCKAPLCTWRQVLGNLTFTTQTKMRMGTLELNDDEVYALSELQDARNLAGGFEQVEVC